MVMAAAPCVARNRRTVSSNSPGCHSGHPRFAWSRRESGPGRVIVAELAVNAVTHGRVPGRDFELRLSLVTGSVRIEVTDTRSGPPRPPGPGHVRQPPLLAETGHGLLLVDALADRWEVVDRDPPPGKTVRAEVDPPLGLLRRVLPRR